jgi:hypothetical protein
MAANRWPFLPSDRAITAIAVGTLLVAILADGLLALDSSQSIRHLDSKNQLLEVPDSGPWAGSTGFISLPSAAALARRPRWADIPPSSSQDQSVSLAIVGLPVDAEHTMLAKTPLTTYCIARQSSASEQSVALCSKNATEYALIKSGKEFSLCDFTEDCWHSTAAAILAAGNPMDKRLFSFQAIAAVPFKDGTGDLASEAQVVVYPNTPTLYEAAADVPGLFTRAYLLEQHSSENGKKPRLSSFEKQLTITREQYESLPSGAYPMAEIYKNKLDANGLAPNPRRSLVNRNILFDRGSRNGGPVFAVNVFSRVENRQICAAASRRAPCVLTNLSAQEKALQFILQSDKGAANESRLRRPPVGAILIVAGGQLTDRPCDNTPMAKYISELRKRGVYTFVPAGNDGKPFHVRFPGCASDAVTVGALNRDGKVSPYSNGSATEMIKLYSDGDTLVVPIRASPIAGLACMLTDGFSKIVRGYQYSLARLGHYSSSVTGTLDSRTYEAVFRFQRATTGLAPTGKLDVATLFTLEQQQKRLNELQGEKRDDPAYAELIAVSSNLRWSGLADLSGYTEYYCGASKRELFYEAQYVSGTLVSASVAAGQFLRLLDDYREIGTIEAYNAIMAIAARNERMELDLASTESYLKTGRPFTLPTSH